MEEAGLTPKVLCHGICGAVRSRQGRLGKHRPRFRAAFLQVDPVVDAASGELLPPRSGSPVHAEFPGSMRSPRIRRGARFRPRWGHQRRCRRARSVTMAKSQGVALGQASSNQQEYRQLSLRRRARPRAHALSGRIMNEWINAGGLRRRRTRKMTLRKAGRQEPPREVLNTEKPLFESRRRTKPQHFPVDDGSHSDHCLERIRRSNSLQRRRRFRSSSTTAFIAESAGTCRFRRAADGEAARDRDPNEGSRSRRAMRSAEISSRRPRQKAQEIPPASAASESQQAHQMIHGHAGRRLQKLQLEKAGKVIDNQFKLQIEQMKIENARKRLANGRDHDQGADRSSERIKLRRRRAGAVPQPGPRHRAPGRRAGSTRPNMGAASAAGRAASSQAHQNAAEQQQAAARARRPLKRFRSTSPRGR